MQRYLNLLDYIIKNGTEKTDRTGTGTLSITGYQIKHDLSEGFPLLTTKRIYFRGVIHELLWFLKGETNIKYLIENNVHIWDDNAFDFNKKKYNLELTREEWENKIKSGDYSLCDLGPVYGHQWSDFNSSGINQIQNAIDMLKSDPDSRRIIVNAWNPIQLSQMALPPCHMMFQFLTRPNKNGKRFLDLCYIMRSNDIFLGWSFNEASYATLLMMVAKIVDMEPGQLIYTGHDVHLYLNHLEQAKLQLNRIPRKLPKLEINYYGQQINEFKYEDFKLIGYDPYPTIKAEMSV